MKAALMALGLGLAAAVASAAPPPLVLEASYEGVISPPAAEYLEGAVDSCERRDCAALLVRLDTPGGLDASMRGIVKAFLSSTVPIIVYVAPAGARAASAGVFITMAADVAAMAPGTNIGAAHPVELGGLAGGGAKPDAVMETKIANDAVAYLEAIAAKRGRNASWAQYVILRSSSVPAAEAERLGVVDLRADSVLDLLAKLDGRKLEGRAKPLALKGARVEELPMTARQRLLAAVSDPNVAMILMTLGVTGLLIELYSPGLILPGIVGTVSLVLAFYSFQTLSAGYAGLALMGLGVLFMLLELKYHSFGLLALSGAAAVIFGAVMVSRGTPGVGISRLTLAGSVATLLGVVGGLLLFARSVLRRNPRTGIESLLGGFAVAQTELSPRGSILFGSETWSAVSGEGPIPAGTDVEIVGHDGLTLTVRRKRT